MISLFDPQSGCIRQCLGVGAKTVETLGLVMTLGLFNSFFDHQILLQLGCLFFLELVVLRGLQLGTLKSADADGYSA